MSLLKKKRRFFIPRWDHWLENIAKRDMRVLFSDSHALTIALNKTQQLFRSPVICLNLRPEYVCFDLGVEGTWEGNRFLPEPGKFPFDADVHNLLSRGKVLRNYGDAMVSLRKIGGPDICLIATIPGIAALQTTIFSENTIGPEDIHFLSNIGKSMARMFGELNIFDAVLIDDAMYSKAIACPDFFFMYSSISNLLRFYALPLFHIISDDYLLQISRSDSLRADTTKYIIPARSIDKVCTLPSMQEFGIALSSSIFSESSKQIDTALKNFLKADIRIITTEEAIPQKTDFALLQQLFDYGAISTQRELL